MPWPLRSVWFGPPFARSPSKYDELATSEAQIISARVRRGDLSVMKPGGLVGAHWSSQAAELTREAYEEPQSELRGGDPARRSQTTTAFGELCG